ncbi:MAG TPA: endolytic transglycosylase MltG, partial [Chitinophagaceae bacterium]|nr:endolytic transglycosylase MltG [Chitinophagaceae bacterium]
MKKIILYIFVAVLVVAAFLAWKIAGPGTSFEGKNYYLLIPTGSSFEAVTDSLEKNQVLSSQWLFGFIAQRLDYPQKVKAGRYNIKSGMSLVQIIRMLRNGQQEPVK